MSQDNIHETVVCAYRGHGVVCAGAMAPRGQLGCRDHSSGLARHVVTSPIVDPLFQVGPSSTYVDRPRPATLFLCVCARAGFASR